MNHLRISARRENSRVRIGVPLAIVVPLQRRQSALDRQVE